MRCLKKVLTILLNPIFWLLSQIFSYHLCVGYSRLRNFIYTLWIRNFLGAMGDGTTICYPCQLQGGESRRIIIGCGNYIHSNTILGCWKDCDGHHSFHPKLIIGNHCSIGENTQITVINKITIGDGLLTGRYVYIGDNAHGGLSEEEATIPPSKRKIISKGEIKIGNNVWIGDKVSILGGVSIGDNAIIGANSVVTHDVPSNSMAAGIPAKIIKKI